MNENSGEDNYKKTLLSYYSQQGNERAREKHDVKKNRVCQEKCVSFFVIFFTSVNLFCYLQIYHHHF